MSVIERDEPHDGCLERACECVQVRIAAQDASLIAWRDAERECEALKRQLAGAVEALAKIKRVYTRTMPGPKDALRDRVLEIIAAYRSTTGGQ